MNRAPLPRSPRHPHPSAPTDGEGQGEGEGLILSSVEIRFRRRGPALFPPLSLRVAPGTVTTILGPSGSGKSTLLRWIGGHLDPAFEASGRVLVNGIDRTGWPAEQRRIGMLFQEPGLFPHLSVGGNLAFGLRPEVRGRGERKERVREALASAGLDGFADRDPATLSGGQQTRVALLRALLAEPEALLLDEPFASLDAERRAQIRSFVFQRIEARGIPTLLVTHDPGDAPGTVFRLREPGEAEGDSTGNPE